MAAPTQADYADIFFRNFATLRLYAERVFIDGSSLTGEEEGDLRTTMDEFLNIGQRCDFTERQLITLLYAELF